MAVYLFDFDGTIADSFPLACDLLLKNAKYLRCKQLSLAEIAQLKEMDVREIAQYFQIPFWRIAGFVKKLRKLGNERIDEVKIFSEWLSILKTLKENKHELGIVSSNSLKTIKALLIKNNLYQLFDSIHCGASLFGKKRQLKKIITQRGFNPNDTYYIGDEVRDIEAAQANNIHTIAVSWGFNSINRLKLAKPEYLMENINQLQSLLINSDFKCDFLKLKN